jgi:O-6-methylguanine DNA methyltransferase
MERTLARELERYLARGEWCFSVPLDLPGGTDFDRAVWKALRRIPTGRTRTYGEVARRAGRPRAARAVGNACGRNPVPVVVPCHRVVAAGGIGGFGLGLGLKRRLLALEGIRV